MLRVRTAAPYYFISARASCHHASPGMGSHEAVRSTYTGISIDTVLDKLGRAVDTNTLVAFVADRHSVAP